MGTIRSVDDPDIWRWVWLAAAVVFGLGELSTPGAFFLAPFAVGAIVASALSFLGASVGVAWFVFVLVSVAAFAGFRPLARRLQVNTRNPLGVGATRLIGEHGIVLATVPEGPDELGLVRIGREEWRAQSVDGSTIETDTPVTVLEVRGTRVVVFPTGLPIRSNPPERSS